ncbi:MAG: iron uptake porin [Synechococcaceae cyanobacterium]|nr:iron uptake porin [Synechococcaceae cyanobacterium]
MIPPGRLQIALLRIALLRIVLPLIAPLLALLPAGAASSGSSPDSSAGESSDAASLFQDVRPGDRAHAALAELRASGACKLPSAAWAGAAGRLAGSAPISRFEAAALVKACLDQGMAPTDALRQLSREFARELALLQGRSDGLEARAGELTATAFSTTTKLSGQVTMVLGASRFRGSAIEANAVTPRGELSPVRIPDGTSFNYDLQLSLDTSFSGKDLLRAILRGGNFDLTAFGDVGVRTLSTLEIAFNEPADRLDSVTTEKLYYQTPLGGGFTATIGASVGQEDMLALWPSVYPGDTLLNVLTLAGAPGAYNLNLGPGAGLWWKGGPWSVSASYVSTNGSGGDPGSGGFATAEAAGSGTVQLGYNAESWALAAIWSWVQNGYELPGATSLVIQSQLLPGAGASQAFGFSGYWQPSDSGWLPSISGGYGFNLSAGSLRCRRNDACTTADLPPDDRLYNEELGGLVRRSESWMVGLQWSDVIRKGNQLGLAIGQPALATALRGGLKPDDGVLILEGWYKAQITDAIRITPGVFWISRPLGQETPAGRSLSQLGALIKTTFSF